ncbi:MAG TPA: dUTP diphosphatase [Chitinophagales bacterium]|nr:dUTP diphosphatase [Chitinophagales bacterium]
MKFRIKKLTESAKLPCKAHPTDLGYDLFADETVKFWPGDTVKIKTGICVGFPQGWGGFIEDRSSMALKGFSVRGGIIDNGFVGELSVVMFHAKGEIYINKGDKIAQLVPIPLTNFEIEQVEGLEQTDRGENGFGSSDKK